MLLILFDSEPAWWDAGAQAWKSEDPFVEKTLKGTVPWETIAAADAPFREGGVEGIVLRAAQSAKLGDIEVKSFVPVPPPEEQPGQDD